MPAWFGLPPAPPEGEKALLSGAIWVKPPPM